MPESRRASEKGLYVHTIWPRPNLPVGTPCRHFLVGNQEWTVCEDPGARGDETRHPALVYYGPGIARRVRTFPLNWIELSEGELYALSWGR